MLLGESQFSKGGIFKQLGLLSHQLQENAYRNADYEINLCRKNAAKQYCCCRKESKKFSWNRKQLKNF